MEDIGFPAAISTQAGDIARNRVANADSDDAWTDHAQREEEKSAGNKYSASRLEGGDLGQHRRLPQCRGGRDNAERWCL